MKNVVDWSLATRILIINRRSCRLATPSRFRTKVVCIKNNVLLFSPLFLTCLMFLSLNRLPQIRATIARFFSYLFPFPSSLEIFLAAWAWRENQFFFLPAIFFTLSSVKFSRQTDNTDGSFRQKPRTSKSEKRWSFPFTEGHFEFFFFVYFLHLGVSFSHSHWHSLALFLFLSPEPACRC